MDRFFLLMVLCGVAAANNDDWTQQCNKCKCVWSGGKRTADCANQSLSEIPKDLSPDIREIDFSANPLHQLTKEVMINAQLSNIHKLKFVNCSISVLEETAFKGLVLMIELDLSRNSIPMLTRTTFNDTVKLRVLYLSHNKLKKLDDWVFNNLTHLQKVFLDNNEIQSISDRAFSNLPALQNLNLAENRLTVLNPDFLDSFPKLISLNLEGNPWVCDCHLQEFRNKTRAANLITTRTICAEPPLVKGSSWNENIIFACVPQIVEPLPSTHIEVMTSNVTLTCRVLGDPQPDVNWVYGSKIIEKDPRLNIQRFITSKQKVGDYTWNNLTITNVNYRDKGEYRCVATNPGGVDEKNVSLIVSSIGGFGGGGHLGMGGTVPLIIALSVGAIVVLIVILILVCCCCKKNGNVLNAKRRDLHNSSEECMSLHHGQSEIEKQLITDVNPVVKPPRMSSVPPSIHSGGTEVSEVKRNLLDSDSVFAGDDESHSFDFDMHPYRKSSTLLEPDYRGNHPYPPDLLPFPPRMCQVSPAGSSASTVADTSRLPAHHGPQSPLHSPIYDSIGLYRTLPYSRSQSPFVGAAPPRVPRQGYVTIPRRPKQRWSETPSVSDAEEPMYDNMGLRTTADGSSMLSLNKAGEVTPKSARLFPSCDPIAEHDSPPPRKVAPVPPPKPKKRTSTGPLFEDEGEDGTEV